MIEEVRIRNLGVIESADLQLGHGMTALTGETGAGKTMALTSLDLLMGGKADPSKVRSGADLATVEGTFVVAKDSPVVAIVSDAGGTVEFDGESAVVLVSRHVPVSGRSRAFIGGRSVPQAILAELASHLVTVHGQSDQLRLKSSAQQRAALDSFGGAKLAEARAAYGSAWESLSEATAARDEFARVAKAAGTERLALEALVARVEKTKPAPGEDDDLKAEARVLENSESLRAAMTSAADALAAGDAGEPAALELLGAARKELSRAAAEDPYLGELATQLADALNIASEVSNAVGERLASLLADPERLNDIYERRAELTDLQRELSMTIPEILEAADRAGTRLAELTDPAAHLESLDRRVKDARAAVAKAGKALTAARKAAATRLSAEVGAELAGLAMKDATFAIEVAPLAEPAPHGLDDVEFRLAAHRGVEPAPLASAASGGELSRIMLALEVTLAAQTAGSDHTFIFDEVDAGIGGKSALSVGQRLARLGRTAQVLAVTHLAQVAAYATTQIVVAKQSDETTTRTDVVVVEAADRERELARMLSGHEESDAARTHAAELLRGATLAE